MVSRQALAQAGILAGEHIMARHKSADTRALVRARLGSAREIYHRMQLESGAAHKVTLDGLPRPLRWLIQSLLDAIGEWWSDLAAGDLTVNEWVNQMRDALAEYHLAGFMAGNASEDVSDKALSVVADQLGVQLDYLNGFKVELQSAAEFAAGAQARAESYAPAIKVPYWTGKTKVLPLPAMPAQGTQCLNNCGCLWRVVTLDEAAGNYDAYWERHKDDSCQTCIQREADWSPVRIRDGMLE